MGGDTYTIKITIISANSLVGRNPDGLSNPYVTVHVGSQSGTTAPKMRVLSADFDHTFQFVRCCLPASLRIRVMSSGADGEVLLGAATMTLITPTEFSEKTLPLSHGGDMVLAEIAPFGCGTVKISYEITETPKPPETSANNANENSMPAEAPAVIALGPPPPTTPSQTNNNTLSVSPPPQGGSAAPAAPPSVIVLGGPPPPPTVVMPPPPTTTTTNATNPTSTPAILLPPPTIPIPAATSFPVTTTYHNAPVAAPAPPSAASAPVVAPFPPPTLVPPTLPAAMTTIATNVAVPPTSAGLSPSPSIGVTGNASLAPAAPAPLSARSVSPTVSLAQSTVGSPLPVPVPNATSSVSAFSPPLPQFTPIAGTGAAGAGAGAGVSPVLSTSALGGATAMTSAVAPAGSQGSVVAIPPATAVASVPPTEASVMSAQIQGQSILHPAAVAPGVASLTPAVMAGISPLSASALSAAGPQAQPQVSESTPPRGSPSRRSSPNASVSSAAQSRKSHTSQRSPPRSVPTTRTTSGSTSDAHKKQEAVQSKKITPPHHTTSHMVRRNSGSERRHQHHAASSALKERDIVKGARHASATGVQRGSGGTSSGYTGDPTQPPCDSAAGASSITAPRLPLRTRSTSRGAYQRAVARNGEIIPRHPNIKTRLGSQSPTRASATYRRYPCEGERREGVRAEEVGKSPSPSSPSSLSSSTTFSSSPPPLLTSSSALTWSSSAPTSALSLLYSDTAYLFRSASTGRDLHIFEQIRRLDPQLDRGFTQCRDFAGRTLLHIAAWYGRIDVMEVLLRQPDSHGVGRHRGAAIGSGGGASSLLIDLRSLLTSGSRENVCHTAARGGQSGVVVWLRSQLPAVTALLLQQRNARGLIPAECAKECGFSSVAEMLIPVC